MIRRVDGREPGEAIVARTAAPLGLDFHIGLDDSQFGRVAHMARSKGSLGDAAAQRMLKTMMSEPLALTTRAFTNPPSILTSTNKPEWRRMQQPAANGHGNARALAGFYSGLLQGRLLEDELLGQLAHEHAVGEDRTLLTRTRFGLGTHARPTGRGQCDLPDSAPRPSATLGRVARSASPIPERDLAFSFVSNALGPYVLMDPRAQQLARVAGECL
ncbi:putative esterase [Pseudomonas aeruginosa]|nr:putative esterase [Pseudomonas aeruginosa]